MGNRLTHGLGRRGHSLDMLGVGEGKVNVEDQRIAGQSSPLHALTRQSHRPSPGSTPITPKRVGLVGSERVR
jgi:hypothetical protein